MPDIVRPLDDSEFMIMGFTGSEPYFQVLEVVKQKVPLEHRNHIANTIQRLADTDWISKKIAFDIRKELGIGNFEGLISLIFYLLLTCADTLGHIHAPNKRAGVRFQSFFDNLPSNEQNNLTNSLHVWKTNLIELTHYGLVDSTGKNITYPSHQQIISGIATRPTAQKFNDTVDYLYQRRNSFTHESEFPQSGWHPNLSVIWATALKVPNVATMGDRDRLQVLGNSNDIYFTYFVDEPIGLIRLLVLKGLGKILLDYASQP